MRDTAGDNGRERSGRACTLSALAGAALTIVIVTTAFSDARHDAATAVTKSRDHETRIGVLGDRAARDEERWRSIQQALKRIESKLER